MRTRIDWKAIRKLIEGFRSVEEITDILIVGEDGGIRRIQLGEDSYYWGSEVKKK